MKFNGKFLVALLLLNACSHKEPEHIDPVVDPVDTIPAVKVPEGFFADSVSIAQLWNAKFAEESTVASADDVQYMRWTVDNEAQNGYDSNLRRSIRDLRYEFVGEDYVRFVSESDGYALSLPKELGLQPDFTIAKYGQKFVSDDVVVRVTAEKVTPYPATEQYYGIYTTEWLDRYISNRNYVNANGLTFSANTVRGDETIVDGYSINVYSIVANGLEKPYYKIALVRPVGQWSRFCFILMKTRNSRDSKYFDQILRSVRLFTPFGTSKNYLPVQEARPDPNWSQETAAYYQKLIDQKTFDFGVFSYSMPDDNEDNLEEIRAKIAAEKSRLETLFGRPFDIMPTYKHIGWYDLKTYFPSRLAAEFAGGNGFNGKPVLQFSYQYTTNNNNVSPQNKTNCYTPVFDLLRGKLDDYLHTLAGQIKAYGKPVLLRLNNEMNSDWTSYCGMMLLCDPDIFIDSWRYLYDLFAADGVDNCIWEFNPIEPGTPYSNWGENLAYYPGNDYVQILAVTNYEMGNSVPMSSFHDRYTAVYNNSTPFVKMPWIIGEFACGAGGNTSGALGRYAHEQAEWVRGMFDDFYNYDANPYLHPLKGGVWFSCNDYSGDDIVNYLELDSRNTETMDAFSEGFARMYGK